MASTLTRWSWGGIPGDHGRSARRLSQPARAGSRSGHVRYAPMATDFAVQPNIAICRHSDPQRYCRPSKYKRAGGPIVRLPFKTVAAQPSTPSASLWLRPLLLACAGWALAAAPAAADEASSPFPDPPGHHRPVTPTLIKSIVWVWDTNNERELERATDGPLPDLITPALGKHSAHLVADHWRAGSVA
jgi:hypothetical protein